MATAASASANRASRGKGMPPETLFSIFGVVFRTVVAGIGVAGAVSREGRVCDADFSQRFSSAAKVPPS